jgi:orotidine-5'-phosphate decarboxylase
MEAMFKDKLARAWSSSDSMLCVGLDTHRDRIPPQFKGSKHAIFGYNQRIIEATHDLVCAYKPQIAHYAVQGLEDALLMTIEAIRKSCPDVLVILDAKRGDIGSTAERYATEAFERYKVKSGLN